jgi:two-component sensor histidine kinase
MSKPRRPRASADDEASRGHRSNSRYLTPLGRIILVLSIRLERFGRLRRIIPKWRPALGPLTAVALVATGGLLFDATTPDIISVSFFYVGLALIGFWFPEPKSALALALLATPLIIIGHWITIPDNTPEWQGWVNRALAIGTVWMTAVFVWHIRLLELKLERQVDITDSLSREMNHRVGNLLQFVSAFLRLQAAHSSSEEERRALELAGFRVGTIGNIQRMLSHSAPSSTIDSKAFIAAIIKEVRSAFPNPEKVSITVRADSAELSSTKAIALGALLLELVNNALKHAFPNGMNGMLNVNFTSSNNKHVLEFTDDGVGIDPTHIPDGFGTQSAQNLARLIGGSITCQPGRETKTRPGTRWRLEMPA